MDNTATSGTPEFPDKSKIRADGEERKRELDSSQSFSEMKYNATKKLKINESVPVVPEENCIAFVDVGPVQLIRNIPDEESMTEIGPLENEIIGTKELQSEKNRPSGVETECDENKGEVLEEVKFSFEDKFCCVCGHEEASLRCPNCLLKYCNLQCFKRHKELLLCKKYEEKEKKVFKPVNKRNYHYPTKDTLSPKALELMSTGENLVKMKTYLKNKKLRNIITHLNATQNPIEEFRKIMRDEEFVAFSDFILRIVREQSTEN